MTILNGPSSKTESGTSLENKVNTKTRKMLFWLLLILMLLIGLLFFQWRYEDNGKFRISRITGRVYFNDNGQWIFRDHNDPAAPQTDSEKEFLKMIKEMLENYENIAAKAAERDIKFMINSSINELKKYGYIPKDKPVDYTTLEKAYWEYVENGMGPKKTK
jgi:hypothetical protein